MPKFAPVLLAWLPLVALAGCSVFEGSRPWPNERRIVSRDWVKPQIDQQEQAVYCYRTLAAVECHAQPVAGGDSRAVSSYEGPSK